MQPNTVTVWQVWAWNGARLQWTIRSTARTEHDAREVAEAMRHRDRRARVRVAPATRKLLEIRPPVNNATRQWRLDQAGRMSDRADDRKRYKSPG